MKDQKLVSTLLCCHRVDDYLYKSIHSIISQTYDNHELIIIFDNADDDQFFLLKNFITKFKKIKIVLHKNKTNMGLTKSLNLAINLSNGEYLMRQDSDDISHIDRMSTLVNYLNKYHKKHLVFSNVKIIDESGNFKKNKVNYIFKYKSFSSYNYKNTISHPSIMIRKSTILKIDLYDIRFLVSQDYELIHRLLKQYPNSIGKVNKYLYKLRYSKLSISNNFSYEQHKNSLIIIFNSRYNFFLNMYHKYENTNQMLAVICKSRLSSEQKSLFFGYLYRKKIPKKLYVNVLFLFHISILYLFHLNLLIKRFKYLIKY